MKKICFYSVTNPDICFCLGFAPEDAEKGAELAKKGLQLWLDGEEEYEDAGYMEPSEELLDDAGIKYEELDYFDEEGELLPEYENEKLEYICA